jgi:F0F1-type ATP synthase assembly protein I
LFLTRRGDKDKAVSTDSANNGNQARVEDSSQARFARMTVWLLRLQAVLAVAAAIVAGLVGGAPSALAVLAGAGIGVVLTAASAIRSAMLPPGADARQVVSAFHRGMLLKLALAVILFVIVAALFSEWFVPVIAGYSVTLVAYWIALIRVGRETTGTSASNDE